MLTNLAGKENNMMGDDKKQTMRGGAHQMASTPSAASSPPPTADMNGAKSSLSSAPEDRPAQQKNEERSGERKLSVAMAASSQSQHNQSQSHDQEDQEMHDRSRDSPPKLSFRQVRHANAGAKIRRPITLRPSSLDPCASLLNVGMPSLKHARDDEDRGGVHDRLPLNAPQLRIRPILKKELKMSSPLARRGAAEREYLQGQLTAEALRRWKQEQHNEQRKLRWNANVAPVDGPDDDKIDGDILLMVEKLKFGFEGCAPKDGNDPKALLERSHQDPRGFAASPPAILKKTFKRSVSAVLADSGIDEDGNLLFFPDGVPLLRDEDESAPKDAADGSATDGDSQASSHGRRCSVGSDEEHEGGGSASQETYSSEDISPSLIPSDVIWQLGACGFDDVPSEFAMPTAKGNKKVTLRPKMNAPSKSNSSTPDPDRQFKPMNGCGISDRTQSERGLISEQNRARFKYETPDKFYPGGDDTLASSESFQRLSYGNEDRKMESGECAHSSDRPHGGNADKKHVLEFSSPEIGFDLKGRTPMDLKDASDFPPGPPPDFSDSNYRTPDNSEHRKPKLQLNKMPKVPELLSMPGMIHMNSRRITFRGKAPSARGASVEKEDMISPETVAIGLLKEPLSDSDFCTPDNSFHERRPMRKHPGERMPKLPEFRMPETEFNPPQMQMRFQGKSSLAPDAAVEEESVFSPEMVGSGLLLKKPLSDSDFCTPDNSIHDRRSSRKRPGEQMPKLPEFSMPDIDSDGKALLAHDAASGGKKETFPQIVASALLRKISLSESNVESKFITPDDPADPLHKPLGTQLPKMPNFVMPKNEARGKASAALDAEEESILAAEIEANAVSLEEPLLKSNFRTPDHPVDPLHVREQMSNLLATGLQMADSNEVFHHHEAIKTPC